MGIFNPLRPKDKLEAADVFSGDVCVFVHAHMCVLYDVINWWFSSFAMLDES